LRLDSVIYAVNLPDDVTLGGAYDGDRASPAGLYKNRPVFDQLTGRVW